MTTKILHTPKIPKLRFPGFVWEREERGLGEICSEISYGLTVRPEFVEKWIPLISAREIRTWSIDFSKCPMISHLSFSNLSKKAIGSKWDILLSKTWSIGFVAYVETDIVFAITQNIAFLRIESKEYSPIYITHYFRTSDFYKTAISKVNKSTIMDLQLQDIKKIKIFLPQLPEQQKIADFLSVVDEKIVSLEEKKKSLEEYKKWMMQKIFSQEVRFTGENGENFGEWEEKRIGDCCEKPKYGTSKKSLLEGKVPVLRMGNLQNGRIDWGKLKFTSDLIEIEKYALQEGDILFNRTNSPELVGKTSIYSGERQAIYAGYLIRVRCDKTVLLPTYLNFILNSPLGRRWAWTVKSDGVSQSNINSKKLSGFRFNLPPLPEQKEIVRRVESLFAMADRIEQQYAELEQRVEVLPQAILAEAFRGELVWGVNQNKIW